jgi:DNA-binding MarR family transcriptional regulator
MNNYDLPDRFYLSLTEFLLHAKQQVVSISAEFGLTSMQALTLLVTGDSAKPMNSFCKMYDCDASNITGIIDGLEEKKLVSRQPHPKDRRVKVIRLETAGKHLQKQIVKRLSQQSGVLFNGLSTAEAQELAGLITKIAASSKPPESAL